MIKVSLNDQIRICDHCGAKNIKHTYRVKSNSQEMYIGRVCIGKILDVDTSGNKHRALARVQAKINSLRDKSIIWELESEEY